MSRPKITTRTAVVTTDPYTYCGVAYVDGIRVGSYRGEVDVSRRQVRDALRRVAERVTCDNCGAWAVRCTCGSFEPRKGV